jgi:hypothetical protein
MVRLLWVFPLVMLLSGCGAQLHNLPVGKGNTVLTGSVGGPLVKVYGQTLPVPYALVGVTHGLSNRVDLHGDLHLMAAMFKFAGFTPGIAYFPPLRLGPLVPSVDADMLMFSDFNQTRVFPEVTVAVATSSGSRWSTYAGLHSTFQTTKEPVFLPSVFAGTSFRAGRVRLFGELQWLALNRSNRLMPVNWGGISHHGALAPQFGMTFDLGRSR